MTHFTRFTAEPLQVIIHHLKSHQDTQEILEFEVLNPDIFEATHFNGERVKVAGVEYIHRHYQTWLDLAQSLGYSLLTPHLTPDMNHLIKLRMRVMKRQDWHTESLPSGDPEKYGVKSKFARLDKTEEPYFHQNFLTCLRWVGITAQTRVLSLGVNNGNELAFAVSRFRSLKNFEQSTEFGVGQWVGIDHSESAIQLAQESYPESCFSWYVEDLRNLDALNLGRFDLIICLNTLHSSLIDERQELKRWVKNHLSLGGALILSIPQSRYLETHQVFGDHSIHTHHLRPSKSLKMITSMQRYLQQHQFEVHTRGKYTFFIAARQINHFPYSQSNPD